MARNRTYTDDEKSDALAALAANSGNVERTAKQLKIPEATLRFWAKLQSQGDNPVVTELCEEKKPILADSLEGLAFTLAGDLADPAKRASAKFNEVAVAFGIVVDKMQVLRGQPTAITGSLSDAERAARLRALVEQFRCETGGVR